MADAVHKTSICGLGEGIGVFLRLFVNSIFLFSLRLPLILEHFSTLYWKFKKKTHIIKTSFIELLFQFYLFLHNVYCLFLLKRFAATGLLSPPGKN